VFYYGKKKNNDLLVITINIRNIKSLTFELVTPL
jgi:hypothetical protein